MAVNLAAVIFFGIFLRFGLGGLGIIGFFQQNFKNLLKLSGLPR